MRLDLLIASRGLLKSREAAKSAIRNGYVFVGGACAKKPSADVGESAEIEIRGEASKYVGRGGYKLEHALKSFAIDVKGQVCLDLGAGAGGFTDCLLQNGAAFVYAVDVGHGQLDGSLRNDVRVTVVEGVNARDLTRDMLRPAPDFAAVDLSFISLALVLPALRKILTETGSAVCLVKPQFEAGCGRTKNGVVRDENTHAEVLERFIKSSRECGFGVAGITHSPIRGAEGNIEFLAYTGCTDNNVDVRDIVKSAHADLNLKRKI